MTEIALGEAMAAFLVTSLEANRFTNGSDVELSQIAIGREQHTRVRVLWRPNFRIGRAKQDQATCSGSGSKMRDAGIVPDKSRLLQHCGQLRQRQLVRKADLQFVFKRCPHPCHLILVRFARDEDERAKQGFRV